MSPLFCSTGLFCFPFMWEPFLWPHSSSCTHLKQIHCFTGWDSKLSVISFRHFQKERSVPHIHALLWKQPRKLPNLNSDFIPEASLTSNFDWPNTTAGLHFAVRRGTRTPRHFHWGGFPQDFLCGMLSIAVWTLLWQNVSWLYFFLPKPLSSPLLPHFLWVL